jgi:anti-sigma B factor antagonist
MSEFTRSDGLLPLSCTASRPRPNVCVAHLAGELDMATAPFLTAYLRNQTAARPTELDLDLSRVTLLAAAGLTLIVKALKNDTDIHGRLHLIGVTGNRPVERVLRLTGLMKILDVYDDLPTLLDALHGS